LLDDSGAIAEALGQGVVRGTIDSYQGREYHLVRVDASEEGQAEIRAFAESVLAARTRYGWATIAALFFTLAVGSMFTIGKIGTAICSGFVTEAIVRTGCIFPVPPDDMTPAGLAEAFGVDPRTTPDAVPTAAPARR
jgi:hypothetical protein